MRQQDLHQILSDQPIIIKADPRILVKGNIPNFEIMEEPLRANLKKAKPQIADKNSTTNPLTMM